MAHIVIQQDLCKGCELCVNACPRGVILISGQINALGYRPAEFDEALHNSGDHKGCTGCTLCGLVCPETAIEVYR